MKRGGLLMNVDGSSIQRALIVGRLQEMITPYHLFCSRQPQSSMQLFLSRVAAVTKRRSYHFFGYTICKTHKEGFTADGETDEGSVTTPAPELAKNRSLFSQSAIKSLICRSTQPTAMALPLMRATISNIAIDLLANAAPVTRIPIQPTFR